MNRLQIRLQMLRGFAALLVVISHLIWWSPLAECDDAHPVLRYLHSGSFAVIIFFTLSGYIITQVHLKDFNHPERLKRYTIRRLARIYPAYWFFGVIALLLWKCNLNSWDHFVIELHSVRDWIGALTLIPTGQEHHLALGVGWSLVHEMIFYVFIGIAIVHWPTAVVAGGIYLVYCYWGLPFITGHPVTADFRNLHFVPGILGALFLPKIKPPQWLCHLSWVAGFAICEWGQAHDSEHYFKAYFLGCSLIVLGIAALDIHYPVTKQTRVIDWLVGLGTISYSLYLSHTIVQSLVYFLIGEPSVWWRALLYIVAPLPVAWLGYTFIEKPCMQWAGNKTGAKK